MSEFRKQLKTITNNILEKRMKVYELTISKKDLVRKNEEIKFYMKEKVLYAVDDKGKALYSNQAKRDKALKDLLEEDEIYNVNSKSIEDTDLLLKLLEIELEALKYDFKIEEILTRVI
jgi:predicted transcriptional regulator